MYGNCKKCGKVFGSYGDKDKDGKMIMFEPCEHEMPRDDYKVISFQESISCGEGNFSPMKLHERLTKFKIEAEKENKNLWIQLIPTDLNNNPQKPEDVSRNTIRFSSLPYQIADVMTLVFNDTTEMRLSHRYDVGEEA